MNNRGNFNISDEILNIVQDAVNNRNFNRLNHDIRNVVNDALDEVKRSIDFKRDNHNTWDDQQWNENDYQWKADDQQWKADDQQWKTNDYQWNANDQQYNRDSQTWNWNNNQQSYENSTKNSNKHRYKNSNMNNYTDSQRHHRNEPVPKPSKITVPVGKVSGTLFTVFGSIGSIGTAIAASILALIGYTSKSIIMYNIIAFTLLPCFIVSMVLLLNGGRIRKRLKRYQEYIKQMHGLSYFMIKDFSVNGRNNKYIVKDIQKMISVGMFPEGHIDDKKTCFMLNNESYEQYLKLQENMRMREMEDKAKNKEESQEKTKEDKYNNKDKLEPEIRKAIDEGRQYVQKIRSANIEIPGEEISRKLDRLEEVTGKIFDYVETHPKKFPEIKKFTEYFLPTTLKLLDAYKEFDYQPVRGENITSAKKEIEETMDTINHAFENLLDGLFEDAAMDISTDISVMETMFAQEGLAKKNGKI